MIDPSNIVRDDYTDGQLEELLLFCICVANKPAKTIAPRVHSLCGWSKFPFYKLKQLIRYHEPFGGLPQLLKEFGIGLYNQKAITIQEVLKANLNLRTCKAEDLEAIKGIGPKTANAFIMWSRPNEQRAILDTHILKWLKKVGVPKVPRSTPPRGPIYDRLEQEFLSRVPEGMTPAEFDLQIWKEYSNASN